MTARRPSSADGTRSSNQKDTIVSPPSRARSCPSLAMPSIHSIQYKPAPLLAISRTSVCYEYKPTPLLEISSISVCYEEVSQPDTSTASLVERKDTVPSVSITSLGVGLDPVGASPVPPISTDNVVVKPTPLSVDIDDSMDYAVREESPIHSEPTMKSTSSTSKHTAGSGQITRAPPTVRDHSNVLCSTSPTQPHVSRTRTNSRTIDFEEL
jgi:hypothetical protein